MSQKVNIYDIAIIGGGLSGMTACCALAKILEEFNLSAVVCDKKKIEHLGEGDTRILSLSGGSVDILKKWGVWEDLKPRSYPVHTLHLFFPDTSGRIKSTSVTSASAGREEWGRTIPHSEMNKILWDASRSPKHISVQAPCSIEEAQFVKEGILLRGSESNISAKLIISAEGGGGILAKTFNMRRHKASFACKLGCASVAQVKVQGAAKNSGYWFWNMDGNGGVLALVPFLSPHGECAWTSIFLPPEQQSEGIEKMDSEAYKQLLSRLSDGIITGLVGQKRTFHIRPNLAEERLRNALLFVGDAAHQMTPLGGQGYNLTLWTLDRLASSFKKRFSKGDNPNLLVERRFLRDFIIDTQPTIDARFKTINLSWRGLQHKHPLAIKVLEGLVFFPDASKILLDKATRISSNF